MFKAELHMHTTMSDGSYSPGTAVKIANKKKLAAIAITDHNTFRGSSLAERISKIMGGPLIIHGNEVRTNYGDVLVYCPEPHERIPTILEELREWADEQGCVLVAAHPLQPGKSSIGIKIKKIIDLFDAIEVWNSRGLPCLNALAIILAKNKRKPGTSGSDAHTTQEIGTSPVVLPENPSNIDDVLEWIRKGKVRPTYRPLRLYAIPHMIAWSIKRRI